MTLFSSVKGHVTERTATKVFSQLITPKLETACHSYTDDLVQYSVLYKSKHISWLEVLTTAWMSNSFILEEIQKDFHNHMCVYSLNSL